MKYIFLTFSLLLSSLASANQLDDLLQQVKQQQAKNQQTNSQRESDFKGDLAHWRNELAQAQARFDQVKGKADLLNAQFDQQELQLAQLEQDLSLATDNLGEVFGVVRQMTGEFASDFSRSIISTQFPERQTFVAELSQRKALPSLTELEQLWFVLQQDMTESAKVVEFEAAVADPSGITQQQTVVRLGSFNLVSQGAYLVRDEQTGVLQHLTKPVGGDVANTLADWQVNSPSVQGFYFDPAKGDLLTMLARTPTISERITQGGVIGYCILAVLVLGLMIALVRLVRLSRVSLQIHRQMKTANANSNNPLGRIMAVYQAYQHRSTEVLELKLDEAVLREVPALERGNSILKILAAMAPMMGLLGTVTGMIGTFQSITVFGTSDPKLMAGGISMALITTVMGLVAALPLLLIHSVLHGRANRLIILLEQQSIGLIAEQAELQAQVADVSPAAKTMAKAPQLQAS
ncbi:MotA/TolQ/ExbB proton channel family protein [Motilimonas sp. E26]|uniref:MotA/TolQ/ExbB proton channel family protein n=1 Tax=Motilimonas sp. E26 TaxID=2865674 RepID=UPI001E3B8FAC|nr:MotA/TolQ/ExbB proton channel family protein [Motilimonas sp. E26]MCE0557152.1 MotA/TolQ/ExbB proton channel family protein [Motilimonas sp. E26]